MSYINEQFSTKERTSNSLSVYECGYQISGPGHRYGSAVRDHYVIHYIIKGAGTYEADGQTYSVEQGQGFLILPGQLTTYTADEQEPWEYYWVGFDGAEAAKLLELSHLGKESLIFSYDCDDRLTQILSDLHFASKQYASREYAMIGYLYLFFSCLIVEAEKPRRRSAEEYCLHAVRYIEEHIAFPITVQEIADFVGVERSYLFRVFKRQMGCSVQEYLKRYRIERAKILLVEDLLNVTEIANSLGFDSTAHFSRVFRKEMGVPPSHYEGQRQGADYEAAITEEDE